MKETGKRNVAAGVETFGLSNLDSVHWNLKEPALYEAALARNEGILAAGGAFVVETGEHTGRSAKDKFVVRGRHHRGQCVVGQQCADEPGTFRRPFGGFPQARRRPRIVRPGSFRRRRPALSDFQPYLHRICLAQSVHPQPADSSRRRGDRQFHARAHHSRPAELSRRSRASWLPFGDGYRLQFRQEDRADWRHLLCRRDEEVGLHHAQLLCCRRKR